MPDVQHYRDLLHGVFTGKRIVLAIDVLAGATPLAEQLTELGAAEILCVAGNRGTGPIPNAPHILLDVQRDDLMETLRATDEALSHLPSEAVAQIDAFDPAREAIVIGTLFSSGRPIAGRPMLGARSEAQQALEDKTIIDALWDELGIPRAPCAVVPANREALLDAAARLDQGDGTVWAVDNSKGFHGAASGTHWIAGNDAETAAAELSVAGGKVRVMPFLEGVPCSIHGIVFPTETIALRPCELVILRRGRKFVYARCATFWDPRDEDRAHMRDIARRTGEHLRGRVGFRGAFTLDGVMTRDGFRPTELNPRFGGGLGVMSKGMPNLPIYLLNTVIVEGLPLDYRPTALEDLIVQSADGGRVGGGGLMTDSVITDNTTADMVCAPDGAFRIAEEGETADARLALGPGAIGGFLRIDMVPERTPIGPSVAPRAAAAIRAADVFFELGIGVLTAAVDVRPRV